MDARIRLLATFAGLLGPFAISAGRADQVPVKFARDFAPTEGWVKPVEAPYWQELCLNGLWQFQPMQVRPGLVRDRGLDPELRTCSGHHEPLCSAERCGLISEA